MNMKICDSIYKMCSKFNACWLSLKILRLSHWFMFVWIISIFNDSILWGWSENCDSSHTICSRFTACWLGWKFITRVTKCITNLMMIELSMKVLRLVYWFVFVCIIFIFNVQLYEVDWIWKFVTQFTKCVLDLIFVN